MLTLVFAPDGVSTAQLMTELAVDVQRAGSEVVVITTRPHYNFDSVAQTAQPLKPYWPGVLWRSSIEGVTVYHTRVGAKTGGVLRRAVGWAAFHVIATLAALVLVRRADVIFVPSPLLTLGALGRVLARPMRSRLVYNVQELYPDLAIDLGLMRNPLLMLVLRRLELYVYHGSAVVTAITDGIRQAVVAKGIEPSRVLTVPNFVDVSDLTPGSRDNEFAAEHGLTDKFIVMYAGNIGHAQGLESLVLAADLLRTDPDIVFCFVGEGAAKSDLEAMARSMRLENVKFVGHQSYARVPEIYATAHLGVVALMGSIRVGALPSKVFRLMACERPILALCHPTSDLAALVREVDAGEVCDQRDPQQVARVITAMRADPVSGRAKAARGRAYVMEHLTRPTITRRYAELFSTLSAP